MSISDGSSGKSRFSGSMGIDELNNGESTGFFCYNIWYNIVSGLSQDSPLCVIITIGRLYFYGGDHHQRSSQKIISLKEQSQAEYGEEYG